MHDFHEADRILKLVLEYAAKNKLKKVKRIVIELGGVWEHGEEISPENLKYNIKLLSKNTPAEGAETIINRIKGNAWVLKEIEG